MTKKQVISRWHILRTRLEREGCTVELDLLSEKVINVRLKTSQDVSALLEWAYELWDDVRSVWQQQDEHHRYFCLAFKIKRPKGWTTEQEAEGNGEQAEDD